MNIAIEKIMSKKNTIAFITLLSIIVTASLWLLIREVHWRFWYAQYDTGHRRAKTLSMFMSLSTEICIAVEQSGQKPPKEISAVIPYLREQFPWLDKLDNDKYLWKPGLGIILNERGIPIDEWVNPVELVVLSKQRYRFISAGPNGKFEQGKSDDIVYEFNPWKFAEQKSRKNCNTQ